jgi:hypothetical protein
VLAILHFNENLHREQRHTKEGKPYFKATYPKFKYGEEVVREVPVPPTYGMMYCVFTTQRLDKAAAILHHQERSETTAQLPSGNNALNYSPIYVITVLFLTS